MLQNTNSSFDQTNQISHSNLEISIIFAEYERNISNSKFIYFDHPKKKKYSDIDSIIFYLYNK